MIDITLFQFDEWLEFLFDRVNPADRLIEEFPEPWESDAATGIYAWSEANVIEYSARLFAEPHRFLSHRYSNWQISQGLNVIQTLFLPDMACPDVKKEAALECVSHMHTLFRDIFAQGSFGNVCYMWFEGWPSSTYRDQNMSTKELYLSIMNAKMDVLEQILRLPSRDCNMSALHGLGHLVVDYGRATGIIEPCCRHWQEALFVRRHRGRIKLRPPAFNFYMRSPPMPIQGLCIEANRQSGGGERQHDVILR